jgi:lysophospholipase L1-like esterase
MRMRQIVLSIPGVLVIGCTMQSVAWSAGPDGDVNIDGQVDLVDVLWGMQAVHGSRSLLPTEAAQGDVAPLVSGIPQPDGIFNTGDVQVLLRIALGQFDFSVPGNLFNIGDSIGEGEAADGTIGDKSHEKVWSTGFDGTDGVGSFNERFEVAAGQEYYENDPSRDAIFNHAVSGAKMDDFPTQVHNVLAAAAQAPSGHVESVTVLLGNNDVCASSLAAMTDPLLFEADYRAGLDMLAASPVTRFAQIHVSSIPAIYWLWNAKRSTFWCWFFAWAFVPCENLLDNPTTDDCESPNSREDPDSIYPGDGANCQRRKTFHARIRDIYNPILRDVLAEYRDSGLLPNARYSDIFDERFDSAHVNNGDCFHPSTAGHALLADIEWCEAHWGTGDAACGN